MDRRPLSSEYKRLKFTTRCIITIAAKLLHLWFSTCRVKIIGQDLHDRYITGEGGLVGGTWHRGAIFLVWFYRKVHPMIMFSRSKDGDLLAGFAEKLGIIPIRGSSSKGGQEALESMKEFLQIPGVTKTATVLDGPRGPRCVAKKGMIVLAKDAGVPFLPLIMSAYPAITLKKTWDKTLIPLPFSRVTVMYRPPWQIPKNIDEENLEQLRKEVESTLNDMMHEADADTGYVEVS
jgi:lysophospholipid acyltransferase (LPLAT)-like uncharacterized protein